MIIVDTNIISEVQKPQPNPNVLKWLDRQSPSNLFLTAISAAELTFGANPLPDGKRAERLRRAIKSIVEDQFRDRVLPFDTDAAFLYGQKMALCRARGIGIGAADGQIGAIAAYHGAAIATRDTAPFEAFGLDVIDPFSAVAT